MFDPVKVISRLERENKNKEILIEQLNSRLKEINIRLQKLERKLPELVNAEIDQYRKDITEKTAVCAKVIDATTKAVKETIVDAIK